MSAFDPKFNIRTAISVLLVDARCFGSSNPQAHPAPFASTQWFQDHRNVLRLPSCTPPIARCLPLTMKFSRRGFLLSVRFWTLSKVFCCCGALCQKTSAKIWLTELNQSHRIYALDKLARGWDVPQFHFETDRTITTFQPPCPRCGMPMWLV